MRILVLGLVGLAMAGPLAAQQHHPPHHAAPACQAGQACPMHDMKSAEMSALQSFAPDRLLAKAETLKLTNEQMLQINAINDAMARAIQEGKAAPMNHAMCLQASAALMAKALLTDEQRMVVEKK